MLFRMLNFYSSIESREIMRDNIIIPLLLVLVVAALGAFSLIEVSHAFTTSQSTSQSCFNGICTSNSSVTSSGNCVTTRTANSITTVCNSP